MTPHQRTSSKCSTSFPRYRKKDIKGVSLIEELSRIIDVGDFLGVDVDNFNSFIKNSGLIDLPLGGRLFTWMNKARTKLSKLDRFLISVEVVEALPDVWVTAIDRLWSDHNPILLHVSKSDFGPTPFKLFHSWLLRDSFDEIINTELPKLEQYKLGRKLLSHEKFCLLKARIKLDTFESFDLFQKARVKWDIKGDENSKFFHGMIKKKRRAQIIHDYDSNVDFPPFANSSGLCALYRDSLETPISLDEVNNVVYDCGSSNAPGFDGFSFAFVKKYWDDIKVDILEYVNIFLHTGSLPHGSNSSLFTLIPKSYLISIKYGLKQGVPLSSFLFILVMEGLHNALSTAVSSGLLRGVKFGSPEVTISHLFYDDDVIITTEWNANDLDNIIRVLHVLLDRFQSKLSSWKANLLSIGGRHTLIKVVLGSLGIYYFSIFKVPESVLNFLERSRAMFLLGGSHEARKRASIKWKNVLSSYDNVGLNIDSLKALNLALI
ncbi:RNA-directed DNA polymerase, eukaryota, reverse transcriptase zinc-binding domain protein [Tanacetum coccineum]